MSHVVSILCNGENRQVAAGATVAQLVAELGIPPRYVAVEVNASVVPRAEHARCVLQAGEYTNSHNRRARALATDYAIARTTRMANAINSLLDHLAYLHDARCLEVTWDCSCSNERAIRLKVVVDPDAELPSWNGKTLLISLTDVVIARFKGLGYAIGEENIDNWKQGVSDSLIRQCEDLSSKAITVPSFAFTILFRGGSRLEVICSDVSVRVID